MFKKIKQRITNPKVLTAVASGILLILVNLGVIDIEMSNHVTEVVNTVLGIGVAVGIFANPVSHKQ